MSRTRAARSVCRDLHQQVAGHPGASLSCFAGKVLRHGSYQSRIGAPNDHIVAPVPTGRGLPIVMTIGLPAQLCAQHLRRHLTMRRSIALLALTTVIPVAVYAQTASEVERCFQNPAACQSGGGGRPRQLRHAVRYRDQAGGRVLRCPDMRRCCRSRSRPQKLQESLRTLDKYNGPIDGNLNPTATQKAIADWQRAWYACDRQTYASRGAATQCRGEPRTNPAHRGRRRRQPRRRSRFRFCTCGAVGAVERRRLKSLQARFCRTARRPPNRRPRRRPRRADPRPQGPMLRPTGRGLPASSFQPFAKVVCRQ